MTENNSTAGNKALAATESSDQDTTRQRFQKAYLKSRKMMQRIDLDLNRSQIVVVADNGRQIYRPYRWDH
ncbi:MAG TPA: hypothetical protein DEV85_01220 [Vibrio sp.]|uniref:hypothetical protein n=1 Tax=Vibrio TaxID=662 RepID=UPI0004270FD8|nr:MULTISPECIES: hypothetical protein [Vibrio]HCH00497.1 hypothetical protein [Vibrio sp.]